MASTKYTYSLSADFPEGKINENKLVAEIAASPIVTALDYISTTGDEVDIWFKSALSAGDKTLLDGDTTDPAGGLIAAHDNTPTPEGYQPTQIFNEDGVVWKQPQTTNGTPIMNPDTIPPGYLLYVTGSFDDVANDLRGAGDQLGIEVAYDTEPVTDYVEGQFTEHMYVIGGDLGCLNAGFGDWASMMVYAPASSPEDRTSTHDGNANKVPTGLGFNIIVPAPLSNGDWNVDGATLYKGEINSNLVPVPNSSTPQAGYWNWDPTASPSITPVANPAAPDGAYDLYDIAIPIARQANRVSLLMHEKECCPPNVRGKKLLPHWKLRFYVHRHTSGTVQAAFSMKFGRRATTNFTDLL